MTGNHDSLVETRVHDAPLFLRIFYYYQLDEAGASR